MFPCLQEEDDKKHSPTLMLSFSQPTATNSDINCFNEDNCDPLQWELRLMEFKSCKDTRPQTQQEKAQEQRAQLVTFLKIRVALR